MAKRVFVSFDYDKDLTYKIFMIGQSKLENSPFTISDWSLKEEQKESEWAQKARAKIKCSDIVMVLLGKETHKASGVLKEVKMANEEGIKLVQIICCDGYKSVPNAGKIYYWNWNNLSNILS